LENALLIIAQGASEHGPYDPTRTHEPVIPGGNMLWGVTSPSDATNITTTTTTEVNEQGERRTEKGRAFRAYGTLDEAALGYLRALEGVDPDAAKNPQFHKVLDALTTPGLTPTRFGATLDAAGYGTERDKVTKKLVYGDKVARNANGVAKQSIVKFLPQILDGQRGKIASLQEKVTAYDGLIAWIDQRVTTLDEQLASAGESSEQLEALKEELRKLKIDRETAQAMREKIEPLIATEQKLLADIAEFGQTLKAPGAAK
jgi:hypothetical protein